jgi:hypothetical protein
MRFHIASLVLVLLSMAQTSLATEDFALAHSPVDAGFTCEEHVAGQLKGLGDELGTDCVVNRLTEVNGRLFSRMYARDGSRNKDWYGWNLPLLAPCDCEVVKVYINPVVNTPGKAGKPLASHVTFKRADGVHFLYAHTQAPLVSVGDKVLAGQPFARIGNNGYSRVPHVHVGAWRGDRPLQIRWNQRTMKLPPEFRK